MVALLENYLPVLLALLAIFLVAVRGYKKYIGPYRVFRPSWVFFKLSLDFITGKIPRNTSSSIHTTNLLFEDCKKNFSEGILVVWIPKPYLFIYNEEAIKILSQAAIQKSEIFRVLEEVVGSGIMANRNIELWRKRRKMFQPAFHASVLKNYTSVFNKNAAALVERIRMADNDPIEIIDPLKKCSFDNLLATVFGINIKNPTKEAELQQIIQVTDELSVLIAERIRNPFENIKVTLPLFSVGRKFMKSKKEARVVMEKLLLSMEESVQEKNALYSDAVELYSDAVEDEECNGTTLRKSLAEILVENHLQDPSFTREDMIDECFSFMTGGFDSVAHAMMWCLFVLGNHQDVQDKAYNEVENLSGEGITWEDVQNLTYIECVLKEALRLYATIPAFPRLLEKDVQCGKYNIPKGTNIVFLPYMLHRNPEIYPNPEKFDPERFRNNADRNPGSFIPFAEGKRNCPGKKFAMIQMKITLACIVQNFKVTSLQREEDIQFVWEIVLASCPKILLRFTPRCHNSKQR